MSVDTSFNIGYGGYCLIDFNKSWTTFPMTNANYSRSVNAEVQQTFAAWMESLVEPSKIQLGYPTYSWSGSLTFDYTQDIINLIFTTNRSFFTRDSGFNIQLHDGEKYLYVDAVWNSISLSSTAGGLVNGTIAFSSCNNYELDFKLYDESGAKDIPKDFELQPYWQYGDSGVADFSLSFSRNVTPVYLNEKKWLGPSYLRVGLLEASANLTYWKDMVSDDDMTRKLKLGNKTITFNKASYFSEKAYAFSDATGESTKTVSINATALKSAEKLFTIS